MGDGRLDGIYCGSADCSGHHKRSLVGPRSSRYVPMVIVLVLYIRREIPGDSSGCVMVSC